MRNKTTDIPEEEVSKNSILATKQRRT